MKHFSFKEKLTAQYIIFFLATGAWPFGDVERKGIMELIEEREKQQLENGCGRLDGIIMPVMTSSCQNEIH